MSEHASSDTVNDIIETIKVIVWILVVLAILSLIGLPLMLVVLSEGYATAADSGPTMLSDLVGPGGIWTLLTLLAAVAVINFEIALFVSASGPSRNAIFALTGIDPAEAVLKLPSINLRAGLILILLTLFLEDSAQRFAYLVRYAINPAICAVWLLGGAFWLYVRDFLALLAHYTAMPIIVGTLAAGIWAIEVLFSSGSP